MTNNNEEDKTHIEQIGLDSTDFKINSFPDNKSPNMTSYTDIKIDSGNPVGKEFNANLYNFEQESVKSTDFSSLINGFDDFETEKRFLVCNNDESTVNHTKNMNQIDYDKCDTFSVLSPVKTDINLDSCNPTENPVNVNEIHGSALLRKYEKPCETLNPSAPEEIAIPKTSIDNNSFENNETFPDIDNLVKGSNEISPHGIPEFVKHPNIIDEYQHSIETFAPLAPGEIIIPETIIEDLPLRNNEPSVIDSLLDIDLDQILGSELDSQISCSYGDESRTDSSNETKDVRETVSEGTELDSATSSFSALNYHDLGQKSDHLMNQSSAPKTNFDKTAQSTSINDELSDNKICSDRNFIMETEITMPKSNDDISSLFPKNNSESNSAHFIINSLEGSNLEERNEDVNRSIEANNGTGESELSGQTLNVEKNIENDFINDDLFKNFICTQENNAVETQNMISKTNNNKYLSTSTDDTASNETNLSKIETVALNEKVATKDTNISNDKIVGIDCVDFVNTNEAQTNIDISEINKEQNPLEAILADFHSNKAKAVSNNLMPINKQKNLTQIESKFPRSHKEIITPDFGNIVKNVHGIFSSVSGSFMNAYNTSHKPNSNYNILRYGSNPKKEEKNMNNVFQTVTGNSKESVCISDSKNENVLESTVESEETSISDSPNVESYDNGDESTTVFDNKSAANSPINNGVPQNLVDSNETLASNSDEGNNTGVYRLQIQTLEASLAEQRKEVTSLRDRVKQQGDELMNKDHICKDMETKMDMMRKRVERAERDADASVMRYATSERAVLEARSAADNAKKAEKQAVAESELLNGKLRSAHAEKARICRLLDDKIHELSQSERELNRLKEEIRATDTKLKWTQNKLRTEMDAYKDSTSQVDKLTEQLTQLQSQVENTQANVQDSIKAKDLEGQLQQCQASLILERHERERAESKLKQITSQAELSSAEVARNIQELEDLRLLVKKLSANNLELEEEAAELATLRAKAALSDTLATQLQNERARAFATEESRAGAEARGAAAALREGAALEHAAKVTAEHVVAQARAHQHESKALALAADNVALRDRLSSLESEVTRLRTELAAQADQARQQTEAWSARVAELEQQVEDATRKLEWEVGESAVLKKKHASATKELNRELQRSLKRCQYLESRYSAAEDKPGLSNKRRGSISSINSLEANTNCQTSSDEGRVDGHTPAQTEEPSSDYQSEGPSRQMLIERVVDLQRAAARRAERCDFLEEHTRALTTELRNKTRLVRHLAAAQPSGALDTPQRDQHKSEVARKGGGAMAAVYGGDSNGLTLELSLEINQKLQAVLEDALLKNITLRENMDTLGAEIARLKSVQQGSTTNEKSLENT